MPRWTLRGFTSAQLFEHYCLSFKLNTLLFNFLLLPPSCSFSRFPALSLPFWASTLRFGHGGRRSLGRAPELGGLTDQIFEGVPGHLGGAPELGRLTHQIFVGAPVLAFAKRPPAQIPGHPGTPCRQL